MKDNIIIFLFMDNFGDMCDIMLRGDDRYDKIKK